MATLWQLSNSYKLSSVSPTTLATYFLYIVSLISIDLKSSRLFNSLHYKAYSSIYKGEAIYSSVNKGGCINFISILKYYT